MPHSLATVFYASVVYGILSFCVVALVWRMIHFSLNQPRGAGMPTCYKCGQQVQSVTVLSEKLQVCDDCWEKRLRGWMLA